MPKSLFKYLRFSNRLLEQLCCDQVYYADPANLNDPLDCQPVVVPDLVNAELQALLAQLVVNRSAKEIDSAMKKVRLRGEKAIARRNALSQSEAGALIGDIDYHATNPEVGDPDAYIRDALSLAIQDELRKTHSTGVLSLSARFDSPLMWSHYADQHRGVCVEYDVSDLASTESHQVSYGGSRRVLASQIRDWTLHDDAAAKRAIDRACLLTKSKEWKYEREYRLLGEVGLRDSRMQLKSVVFGLRCARALQYTVVKALFDESHHIKFWAISQPNERFELKRSLVDPDELLREFPRRSAVREFEVLNDHGAQEES
jgi:Protein of unknown function (DUF2971)